jgi:hypothetical protein
MTEESINPLDGILGAIFLLFLIYIIWIFSIFLYEVFINFFKHIFKLLIVITIFYILCFFIMSIPFDIGILKVVQRVIGESTPWKLIHFMPPSINSELIKSKIYVIFDYFK